MFTGRGLLVLSVAIGGGWPILALPFDCSDRSLVKQVWRIETREPLLESLLNAREGIGSGGDRINRAVASVTGRFPSNSGQVVPTAEFVYYIQKFDRILLNFRERMRRHHRGASAWEVRETDLAELSAALSEAVPCERLLGWRVPFPESISPTWRNSIEQEDEIRRGIGEVLSELEDLGKRLSGQKLRADFELPLRLVSALFESLESASGN